MKRLMASLIIILISVSAFAQTPGWMHVISGDDGASYPMGININSKGDIINCGGISDELVVGGVSLKEGGYVIKYSKNGKVLTAMNFGSSFSDVTSCFETSNEDFILDFDSINVPTKYGVAAMVRADGSRIWTYVYERFWSSSYKIVPGPNGHPLHLGSRVEGGVKYATITSLHKATGKKRWTKKVKETPNSAYFVSRFATYGNDGMIYVAMGDIIGPKGGTVLMALDSNGIGQDSIHIDGHVTAAGLEFKNDKLVFACNFKEEMSFNGTSLDPYPDFLSAQSSLIAILDTKLKLVQYTALGSLGGKKATAFGRAWIHDITVDDDLNILIAGWDYEMLINKADTLSKRNDRTYFVLSIDKNLDYNWFFAPDGFEVRRITQDKKKVFITGTARPGQRYGSHVVDSKTYLGVFTAELDTKKPKQNDVDLVVKTKSKVSESQTLALANKWFEAYYMSGGDSKRFTGKTNSQGQLKVKLDDVDENSFIYGTFFHVCEDEFEERANGSIYYTGNESTLTIVSPCIFTVHCEADFTLSLAKLASDTVVLYENSYTNTGTLNYSWDFGDNTGANTRLPNHYYKNDGTYAVCLGVEAVKDTEIYCMDTLCRTLTVTGSNNGFHLIVEQPVSIDDLSGDLLPIEVFPNPIPNNVLTISSKRKIEVLEMTLHNIKGEDVKHFEVRELKVGKTQLNLGQMLKGVYFLEIVTDESQHQIRVIKL